MSDFLAFKSAFTGEIVTPEDTNYRASIARWAANAERRAKVVAFVKDTSDIALAIQYARTNQLPIAIRGGGHSPMGASSVEGGLVIDLSRYFRGVRVDAEKRLAYVGGGSLWEDVDRESIKHGLATVAGTVNDTGVGGLTLGGGYGWLSGQHGLAIDNLAQVTVVTADGSVVTANDDENPDLFFGVRGGGCNFGVVTEFVYKLHPQRKTVYAGILTFHPRSWEKLVSATAEWWPRVKDHEGMMQVATVSPDGEAIIVVGVFYNGSELDGRANFKAFHDIGPISDTSREIPYEDLNAIFNTGAHHGQGQYYKGLAHRTPHHPSILQGHGLVTRITTQAPNPQSFRAKIIFEYFPLGKINSIPQERTAFRRELTPNVLVVVTWQVHGKAEDEGPNVDKARAWGAELAGILGGGGEEITKAEKLGYVNYDSEAVTGEKESVPDKARLVFAGNYGRLQEAKKKYDPECLFNRWFPITPA